MYSVIAVPLNSRVSDDPDSLANMPPQGPGHQRPVERIVEWVGDTRELSVDSPGVCKDEGVVKKSEDRKNRDGASICADVVSYWILSPIALAEHAPTHAVRRTTLFILREVQAAKRDGIQSFSMWFRLLYCAIRRYSAARSEN